MALPTGKNDSGNLDFKKISAEEKADKSKETQVLKKKNKKVKSKRRFVIFTVGFVFVALLVGVIVYDPFTNSLRFGSNALNQTSVAAQSSKNSEASKKTAVDGTVKPVSDSDYPVTLDDWQKSAYNPEAESVLDEKVLDKYKYSALWNQAAVLPPESAGFTSDVSKQYESGGKIPNPSFSYWTQERFVSETGIMLERIINPVFGDWIGAEFSPSLLFTGGLNDMFTSDWVQKSGSTITNYPLFVDWSNKNYGLSFKSSAIRWVGTINSIDTIWNYNSEISQYEVNLTAGITYTATLSDGSTATRVGTLILTLVANPNNSMNSSDHHVLISQCALTVG